MKEYVRRIFVVLWVVVALAGVAALGSLNEGVVLSWLFVISVLVALQYVLTGTANPINIFDRSY